MQRTSLTNAECPVARGLERVGEWWSILIMRDALQGLRRFDEFSQSLGIAPNMLTRRLNTLVEEGLLERRRYSERPPRYEYVPTAIGEDFKIVIMAFIAWGNRHYAPEGESLQIVDTQTQHPIEVVMMDAVAGNVVPIEQCTVKAGPAASAGMLERLALLADRQLEDA
ncbi:helix-turn-helix transcriptional regulator [Pseudomonas sp. 7P_10.2_Bac1]|uniref:winged helix-turn-helix transcriptional regulator n=1 Tax=Pseudomonas sp. 7P_10.2_Bac1 TaxID=2971614 RepID=UPI0021C8FAB4|nr:helix-turn-helix domain-containing protein [Pseudomonas sp. 7P_10.2_Bac1]MCU1728559.1 helix-turn-helix transcriptional regulator [Pseudomonas sp. 7P_10.2_Bac1]